MKTKNFSKSGVKFELPYLLSLQKESWQEFWRASLRELLAEVSPIRDYTGKELELWFLDYILGQANYKTDLEAKRQDDSYEAPLRVKVRLNNLATKEIKEQEVFLTDFPLMTERGTFVVNGVERVVISQLIRSPGAFFTARVVAGKKYFGAKIIPNRGAWLEFETETTGTIGIKIDRKRKLAATALLKVFGLGPQEDSLKELFRDVDIGEINYIERTLAKDSAKSQAEAMVEVYRRLRPGDMASPDSAAELIENTFFNFERYDLSKVGRWKTWQRLPELKNQKPKTPLGSRWDPTGSQRDKNQKHISKVKGKQTEEEITIQDRILHPEDIVAVLREIIRLNNNPESEPDQIDHLGNRRVRTLNELLQNRLRVGLMRTERVIKDRMSTLDLAAIMPSQLVNPRPFMAVVKEFFTSSQLAQFMDNENPLAELEHKRRLSATGPGGLTRDRAGFDVRDVQPSHYGRICPIQTPEGANIGLVGHLAQFARLNKYGFIETPYFKVEKGQVTKELHYLNAFEEEKYNIAHGGVPIAESTGRMIPERVEARIKGEPGTVSRDKIDFIDVSAEQCISVATSLIPFLQNDDANRALMGSNMQRQSVPLLKPEVPLVGTGLEERVARDSGQVIIAEEDGTVEEVDAEHIVIRQKLKSGADGLVKSQRSLGGDQNPRTKDQTGRQPQKLKTYNLRTFIRTNQYTCFHQRPLVKKGQIVKKGDILAGGGATANGFLALGQNVSVAFMLWRGGNFEDAVVISERLVKDDIFTSLHIEDFSCDVRETKLEPETTTYDIPNVGEEKLKNLDEEGIIIPGTEVGPNDILVGKISPKGEAILTAEERLLRAIFGEKAKEVKDTSLRLEHGKKGRVVGVKVWKREEGHKLEAGVLKRVRVEVAEKRKVKAGDKLAGRHGNKGVISKVLPEHDMPFMEDGSPVDVILNPLSVASRMNIGQILETHLGWAAKRQGFLAVTPSLSGAVEQDIKNELRLAGLAQNGKVTLYDGRTGLPFPEKITVGQIYMIKLIHMVDDKIHMRSIGPYSLITQQPLGGKAQFGGQRFGEMEVWALEGYGAAHILQEMLTIKSDDVLGRAATYDAILKGEPIRSPNIPASFHLLINELKALGLNVVIKEKNKKEIRN